jgi:hypothetical protein
MSTQDERPAPPSGAENSVLDLVRSGRLAQDPSARLDPQIYDPVTQQPIMMGNSDPNIIGPDDTYEFQFRGPQAYPNVPPQVKTAEVRFILPMAKFIADTIGITVIDESAYERILQAVRARSLFVLLNIHKTKIADGIASWFGLILMCKRHPLVMVRFKMRLSTEQIGIDQIRLWEKAEERYVVHREPDGAFYSREEGSALILNYLKTEGVLPGI